MMSSFTQVALFSLFASLASAQGQGGGGHGQGGGSESQGGGSSSASEPFGGNEGLSTRVHIAHGVLAAGAFVIIYPAGAILIRLASFKGVVWVHAAIQALSYLIYIAGAGLGIYLAQQIPGSYDDPHPTIGLVLLGLLFFQPFSGYIHHRYFKKTGGRTISSHLHIWIGRLAITLGIINGGLGLRLAANTTKGEIAYGVVAAVAWIVYIAAIVVGEIKLRKQRASRSTEGKDDLVDSDRREMSAASPADGENVRYT